MIEARNISIGYKINSGKSKIIHNHLSFTIKNGEMTALLGANGCGKSTLIKSISGNIELLSGEVLIEGRQIKSFSKVELAKQIGIVLTSHAKDGGLTVFELAAFGRYPYTDYFGTLKSHDIEIIENALKQVGLWELRESYISQISDGERQKAMIAKVLCQECQTIILDEPTAFLDVKSRLETYSLLRTIARTQNKCILLSTHDLELTLRGADSLMILSKHQPLCYGNSEDMILNGNVAKLFSNSEFSNLDFNEMDGSFTIREEITKPCYLSEGGNPAALQWLTNALLKNGYKPTTSSNCKLTIEVTSNSEYIVNGSNRFSTIAETISYIIMINADND
ncbi:MAG: ABC transporter ATP-binding protein [Rikenellaceae bacterium]